MRNGHLPLTPNDVLQVLTALLAHGHGDLRVVVVEHRIETVYATASLKQPGQVASACHVLTKGEQMAMVNSEACL
jgi:hypothetical protein